MKDKRTYEERRAYYKEWSDKHREIVRQKNRESYQRHKEKRLAKHREWHEANAEKHRELNLTNYYRKTEHLEPKRKLVRLRHEDPRMRRRLKRTHTTFDEYEAIKEKLETGPCEICGKTGPMCIDHCHNSKRFRGILCRACNAALGGFHEDPAVMRAAADYIERKRSQLNGVPQP